MSRENVKKFFELVKTEEQLARKVVEMNDGMRAGKFGDETQVIENQILPIAKEYDLDFTVEEFLAYSQEHAGELSDEMLMAVTGGFMSPRAMAIGLLATTAISFVPSIVGSFASGGGDAVPPVTETSISQTSQDMDEDTVVAESSMELDDSGLPTPPNSPVFAVQGNPGAGGSGALNMDEVMRKLTSLKTDMMRAGADVTATDTEAQSVNEGRDTAAAELDSAYVGETETATTEVKAADEIAAEVEQKVGEKEFELIGDLKSVPTAVFHPFLVYLESKKLGFVEEAELPGVLEAIKTDIEAEAKNEKDFSMDMTNNTVTHSNSGKKYNLMDLLKHENIYNFRSHMFKKLSDLEKSCTGTDLETKYTALKTKVEEVRTLSQAKEANAQLEDFLAKVDIDAGEAEVGVEPIENETSAVEEEGATGAQMTTWKKISGQWSWATRVEHVLQGIKNYSNLDESSREELDGEVEEIKPKIKGGNRIKPGKKVKYGETQEEQANVKQIWDFANGR